MLLRWHYAASLGTTAISRPPLSRPPSYKPHKSLSCPGNLGNPSRNLDTSFSLSQTLSVMADALIFITGATGFIGSHVVDVSLKAGYRVLLSIRKPQQEQVLKERYSKFSSQVETIVISDMTKPELFKEALNGV